MKQRFFVTATGTDIGKSFITAALVRQARAQNRSVMAYKPIISGFDITNLDASDTGVILDSLQLPPTLPNIDRVSPWQFAAPLAPSMAARKESRTLDFNAIIDHSRKIIDGGEEIVLIEGIGGVMVPLDDSHTILDWMEALHIPTIMVTGAYLGTISHTLTALEVMRQRGLPVHSLIVNEAQPSPVPLASTIEELKHWTKLPVIGVKHHPARHAHPLPELAALLDEPKH